MAQGDTELFEIAAEYTRDQAVDYVSGTWKVALVSEPISTIVDSQTSPALADFTEVTGTNYTAGGETLTITATVVNGIMSFKHTGGTITWSQHASGPADVKTAIVYDDDSTTDLAVWFCDMTEDGGATAISLVADDITLTFGDGGEAGVIFTMPF